MKTRIAIAVASLFVASMGATAYAQDAQQMTPPASESTTSSMPTSGMSGSMSNESSEQSGSGQSGMRSGRVEQKIKHELASHGVTATNVDVSFSNGTATLSGTVMKQSDIAKAKKAAMRVRGVKHVDTSSLHVQGDTGNSQG